MPRCEVHRLPLPHKSATSLAVVSDPSGRWIAGHATYERQNNLIVWYDNAPTEIEVPFYYVMPGGITRDGVVAGSANYRDGAQAGAAGGLFGFVVAEGTLVRLASPRRAYHVTITGISRAGLISGWTMTRRGERQRAYVWSITDPEHPRRLRVPRGYANSFGTSGNGHTAVTVFGERRRAFVFSPTGRRTELHGTETRFDVITATAIANGWVAGTENDTETGDKQFVRWNLRNGDVETIPVNLHSITAVNQHGTVAGEEISDIPFVAALFTDRLIRLPRLVPGYGAVPRAVAAGNVAIGGAEARHDRLVAVRWTCRTRQ